MKFGGGGKFPLHALMTSFSGKIQLNEVMMSFSKKFAAISGGGGNLIIAQAARTPDL